MSDERERVEEIPSLYLGLLPSDTPAKETGFCRALLGKECLSFGRSLELLTQGP